jgi:hypothetical protein
MWRSMRYLALVLALCLAPGARAVLMLDAAAGKLYQFDDASFALTHQLTLPYPLHERMALAADGRAAYLSSPRGWVFKLDLLDWRISSLRVGDDTAALALSHDGRYLMAANRQPATLVGIDARDLSVLRVLEAKDQQGKRSAVGQVETDATRASFVAVLGDIGELWELGYGEHAEAVFDGMVHDYKMGEGLALKGPFAPRRTVLERPLAHFWFDRMHALGAADDGLLQVINLDIRRRVKELRLDGAARPDQGAPITWRGGPALLLPRADAALLSVLDSGSWRLLASIPVAAADRRVLAHAGARHLWIAPGPDSIDAGAVQIFDRQSASIVVGAALPAHASAPLAWTRDGAYALLRNGAVEGEILVCDTRTLAVVKRFQLP